MLFIMLWGSGECSFAAPTPLSFGIMRLSAHSIVLFEWQSVLLIALENRVFHNLNLL